ncbi:hypothetical protein M0R45_027959 [Rubus argutus]|uniref:RING-type E3 ubiquitin transferase n=1 Tax=Rubus argutus TaxID=59490 RepID=A0AAW1W4F8_RUBAR
MPKSILITCALIFFALYHDDAKAEKHCPPASCGDLHDIRYPFRLNGTSANNCLNSPAELSCVQNRTILNLHNATYYVLGINYKSRSIQVVDPGLLRDTCPFRPIHRLTIDNFTADQPYRFYGGDYATFYDCLSQVESPDYIKINCSNSTSSSSSTTSYSYIKLGNSVNHLLPFCNITTIIPSMLYEYGNLSFSFIRQRLRKGLQLYWDNLIPNINKYCYRRSQSLYCFREYVKHRFIRAAKITGWSLTVRMVLGIIVLLFFLRCKLYWKKSLMDNAVEEFSHACNNLMQGRYSYSDMKKMATAIKIILIQGSHWKKFLKDDEAVEEFLDAYKNLMPREDEDLQMPPKPFFRPQQMPTEDLPDDSDEMDIEEASILPQSESVTELNSMV